MGRYATILRPQDDHEGSGRLISLHRFGLYPRVCVVVQAQSFVVFGFCPFVFASCGTAQWRHFYWIFTALSSLMETLRERRQAEKLLLFERLWKILVCALAIASLTLLFQIFDLSRSISIRWHYQWFFADGVSHILFLLVLAGMMYLWAPHTNSQRYAYSHAADDEDKDGMMEDGKDGRGGNVWAAEDALDEDIDDESFWATTHGKGDGVAQKNRPMGADTIGADSSGAGASVE